MIELQKKNAHITFTTPSVIGGEGGNVDLSNYYTRDEVDQAIAAIPEVDLSDYYDKNEVDTKIDEIELTPGPAGKDGYTPVKGIDYFDGKDYVLTDADKQEIANMIDVPTGGGGSSSGSGKWKSGYNGDSDLYNANEFVIHFISNNTGCHYSVYLEYENFAGNNCGRQYKVYLDNPDTIGYYGSEFSLNDMPHSYEISHILYREGNIEW